MGTVDEEKATVGGGGGGGGKPPAPDKPDKGRGERSSGDVDAAAVIAFLRKNPKILRSVLTDQETYDRTPQTPKLSRTLDQVPAEDLDEVVEALHDGLALIDARAGDDRALDVIAERSPDVAKAIQKNSGYRRMPIRHSVDVAARYLDNRRAAAAAAPARAAGGRR
jgi:hypothetical protein